MFSIFEDLENISQVQDVIFWLKGANSQSQIESQIRWIRKNHPYAVQYYDCAGFDALDRKRPVWQGMWRYSTNSPIQFFTPDHHSEIKSLMSVD